MTTNARLEPTHWVPCHICGTTMLVWPMETCDDCMESEESDLGRYPNAQ